MFPFGLRRQTVRASSLRAQPVAIPRRFMPRNTGDRLLRMTEIHILPEGWRGTRSRNLKSVVLCVRDLRGGKLEYIHIDAVDGAFTILSRRRSHQKPSRRNLDQPGFER